jgi:flagellar basal body-associated protein FliL
MAENDGNEQPVVEKKSRKRLLGVLVTSVLIVGAGVAGTVLGPRLLSSQAETEETESAPSHSEKESSEGEEEGPVNPMAMPAIIVDVHDKQNQPHHMKVGLTIELAGGVTKEEFERYTPRGREAAITYLRSKTFDELTEPAQFPVVTKELYERIAKAMGEKHVKRVVITDFVAQ